MPADEDEVLAGEWDDDDPEPLPVIDATGSAVAPQRFQDRPKRRARRNPAATPKRGVKRSEVEDTRREVMRDATGKAPRHEDTWRDDMDAGNTGRARSRLTQRTPTHNSGSGFGVA